MRRFARLAALVGLGTLTFAATSLDATAAPAPSVASIAEGSDAQGTRPVLFIVGKGLSKVKSFALKRADSTDVGLVELLFKSGTLVTIGLPAATQPGDYTLEMHFGKTGVQTYQVTVTTGGFLRLAGGDTMTGRLIVAADDGAVFSGAFGGPGTIAASGAGTRFLWYPTKAALRAGRVDGAQWDDVNVGLHSVATGFNTTASGDRSTALGDATVASGFASVSMGGGGTTAGGGYATAMGFGTSASGADALAVGQSTTASGTNAVAMGIGTHASGFAAVATGSGSTAGGGNSFAMGFNTTASGDDALAVGATTVASGGNSVAMGFGSVASGGSSAAFGDRSVASGDHSTAVGDETVASGFAATAAGSKTTASGDGATALGGGTTAQAHTSLAIGRFNVVAGTPGSVVATDPVFVVGNGTSAAAPSNALTLLRNGDMTIAGTLTQNSDARLKTDVAAIRGVLAKLAGVRAVGYRFRDEGRGPSGAQIGLLAQEVGDAFPELVRQGPDGTLSIAYGNFTAVLLAGLKEQQTEIDALRDELARAKTDVAARLARLEALAEKSGGPTPK